MTNLSLSRCQANDLYYFLKIKAETFRGALGVKITLSVSNIIFISTDQLTSLEVQRFISNSQDITSGIKCKEHDMQRTRNTWNDVSVNIVSNISSHCEQLINQGSDESTTIKNITSFAGSDPLATESRFGLLLTHKTTG